MPDFNDVVRHVILRIVVDQESLAGQLQRARGELKKLEDSEKEANKRRVKDYDEVTKAIHRQNDAVVDNAAAHELNRDAAGRSADEIAESYRQSSKNIQDSTKAIKEQNAAAEKAARDRRNDDAANLRKDVANIAEITRKQVESQAKIAEAAKASTAKRERDDKEYADRAVVRIKAIQAELAKLDRNIEIGISRRDEANANRDSAVAGARESGARAVDREDATSANLIRRRRDLRAQEKLIAAQLNQEGLKGAILEQRLADIVEKRARMEDRFLQSRRRGLAGMMQASAALASDGLVAGGRAVVSAPRAARRAARAIDNTENLPDLNTPLAELRRNVTDTERLLAGWFSRLRRDGKDTSLVVTNLVVGWKLFTSGLRDRVTTNLPTVSREAKDSTTSVNRLTAAWRHLTAAMRDSAAGQNVGAGLAAGLRRTQSAADSARGSVSRFFGVFRRDGDDALTVVRKVNAGVRGFFENINRARVGGSGDSLFKGFANNLRHLGSAMDGIGGLFRGLGRHIISLQTLVFAIIVAFGPLAAVLGAVGAAALALASNFVALAGSLAALPALVGALVGAFGALAFIVGPLSKIFSAFSASQEAAARGTTEGARAAVQAARSLSDAQRRLSDSTLAHQRAIEDLPRAYDRLSKARKQARRDIEDYQFALKKLKFEEEGAALGVEQAEQDYRRSLADPTANSLARRQAAHSVEGARFDQEEQATNAARLQQDAAEAFKKGVEGADAVVDALRGVVTAQRQITDSLADRKRAEEDVAEAEKDVAAGGTAARAAQEKLQAELDKLGPKGRKVVTAMLDLNGAYKAMQKRVSDRFFGQLTDDTGKFADVLKILESFIGPTAEALGGLTRQALRLFTNPEWKKFFSSQGVANAKIIKTLGEAALAAAGGFKGLITAAGPLTTFIVEGIKGMAEAFDRFANSDAGQKKMADFFTIVMRTMSELKPVVVDIFKGLYGFFLALNQASDGGKSFTTWFNEGLQRGAKAFKELGEKAQDPNGGFQKWLRDVRPLLSTVADLIGAVGRFFGDLFSNPANLLEAEKILRTIADVWLPQLAEFFDRLSKSELVSSLATAIGMIFEGVNQFFDSGGLSALSKFSDALEITGSIFKTIIGYLSAIPGLIEGIGFVAAVVFGTGFALKFSGLLGILKLIGGLVRGLGDNMKSVGTTDVGDADGPGKKSKPKTALQNLFDDRKDKIRGKDKGTSAAERVARETGRKVDLTGTGGVQSHLTRIERLLGQIRDCVCRMARGGYGSGGDGKPGRDTPTKPRPSSGGGSRPGTKPGFWGMPPTGFDDRDVSPTRESIRDQVRNQADPHRTTTRDQTIVTNRRLPAESRTRPDTLGSQSPELDARNERRRENGRFPLNQYDVPATRTPRRGLPGSITDYTPPLASGIADDQSPPAPASPNTRAERNARNKAARAAARQAGLDAQRAYTIDPSKSAPIGYLDSDTRLRDTATKPTPPDPKQPIPTSQSKARQTGITASKPGQKPVRPPATPVDDLDDVTSPVTRPRRADVSDTQAALPGNQLSTVPTREQVLAGPKTKDKAGRRTKRPRITPNRGTVYDDFTPIDIDEVPVRQPRSTSGQFQPVPPTRPSLADVSDTRAALPAPARPTPPTRPMLADPHFVATPSTPRRDRTTMPPEPVDDDPTPTTKPSRWSRIRDSITRGIGRTRNDQSGSVEIGQLIPFGPDEAPARDRRDATTRPSTRPGRISRRPSGSRPRPGRPRTRPNRRSSGGDFGYGEGYDDGYDDARGGAGLDVPDGDDRDRRKTRRERREEKRRERRSRRADRRSSRGRGRRGLPGSGRPRPASLGRSFDDDDDDGRSRTRRERTADFDDDDDRPRTRRGEAPRPGRTPRAPRLPGAGGLARGLAGGVGGVAASLALSYGGDALINKYVKDDKDAGSLSRGLGAVSTGAGIGAMVGSVVPGVGTLVGGAVGGAIGGAYSLVKDKNLRSFVGDKVGGAAKAVGGFVSGAAKKVSGFVGGLFGGDEQDATDEAPGGKAGKSGGIGDKVKGALKGLAGGGLVGALLGGTDLGKSITDSLKRAGKGIGDFFTRTIPNFFNRGVKTIKDFFTHTLPELPNRGFKAFMRGLGVIVGFFRYDIPRYAKAAWRGIEEFFTVTLPNAASTAWENIKTFFTVTLPGVASAAWEGIKNFFTVTLPNVASSAWEGIKTFFTETLPGVAQTAWDNITNFFSVTLPEKFGQIVDTMKEFFGTTLPNFFTQTLPEAMGKLPGFLYDNIVQPVIDFFSGLGTHIGDFLDGSWDWVKSIFKGGGEAFEEGMESRKPSMSGGFVEGIYQGIQDTQPYNLTIGEFVLRKGAVDQPGAKAFLRDFNEGRVTMQDLYGGLSASAAPQVMSIVPPDARTLTGSVPTVVNNTINHAPLMGNVTIHNPVRETSEHSLRRQVQIAAIRHRR